MLDYEKYIRRCLEIAKNGSGTTSPNPMVGSVIVCDDKIIGEGWHKKAGEPHAEVNAINSVEDKTQLQKSTIFVNLEPCSHYGKTPPCAELIIKHKIPKVVICNKDPHEKVAGKGIEMLRSAGIEVVVGILEQEGEELNKRFFTFHRKKRPYIILKWAKTQDDFIDICPNDEKGAWISNDFSKILVHKWRTEEDAIMVGTNTALKDNPQLNVRLWKGKNPIRVVLDKNLRLPHSLLLFDGKIQTIVFTEIEKQNENNINYEIIEFNSLLIENILERLYKLNIQSIIIEGGAELLNSFIEKNIWDEARIIVGDKKFSDGIKSPQIESKYLSSQYKLQNDNILIYRK